MDTLSDAYSFLNRKYPGCKLTSVGTVTRSLIDVHLLSEDLGHWEADASYLFVQGEDLEQLI